MPLSEKDIHLVNEITEPDEDSNISRRIVEPSNVRSSKKSPKSVSEKVKDEIKNLSTIEADLAAASSPVAVSVEDAIARQKKIRNLLTLGDKIDKTIDEIADTIKKQTKNYNFQVDISNSPPARKAVKKIFKKSLKYIDKEMYLYAVEKLQELQEKRLDKELKDQDF